MKGIIMNKGHKLSKIKNRINRCKKKIADKDIIPQQKHLLSSRLFELEDTLKEQSK